MARLFAYQTLASTHGRQPVRTMVDNGQLRRLDRGIYASGRTVPDDRLRALFLRLPPGALLSHHSAAQRHGFGVLTPHRVHVTIPAGSPRPLLRGVAVHEAVLDVRQPVMVGGIPCVPPARCAVDLARVSPRPDALAVLDAALRSQQCTATELEAETHRHAGLRGVRQARRLVELADGSAECVQESHLRLLLVEGRLPRPELQIWIYDDGGGARYRVDMGYRERRLGIEYDGRSHTERHRLRSDRRRHNWLASRGWNMRYFTDADLYGHPAGVLAIIRSALL
jgi:hypothetical protein